jgi:hypothetical protein
VLKALIGLTEYTNLVSAANIGVYPNSEIKGKASEPHHPHIGLVTTPFYEPRRKKLSYTTLYPF